MPIVGETGNPVESEFDGDVPGDDSPALQGLRNDDVIDESGIDARSFDRRSDCDSSEFERIDIDERTLPRSGDGRSSR
jgi:hypothetical protein